MTAPTTKCIAHTPLANGEPSTHGAGADRQLSFLRPACRLSGGAVVTEGTIGTGWWIPARLLLVRTEFGGAPRYRFKSAERSSTSWKIEEWRAALILLVLVAIVFGPAAGLLTVRRSWLIPTFGGLMLATTLAWWTVFGHSCANAVFAFMDDAIAKSSIWITAITGLVRIVWDANRIELERELPPLFTGRRVMIAAIPLAASACLALIMLIGGDPSCS